MTTSRERSGVAVALQERARKVRVRRPREAPARGSLRRCLRCGQASALWPRTGTLCPACAAAIAAEAQARVGTIQESLRLLKAEPSVPGKLRYWDLVLAQAAALQLYEARGILTTCPPPSTLLQDFQAQREALARTG